MNDASVSPAKTGVLRNLSIVLLSEYRELHQHSFVVPPRRPAWSSIRRNGALRVLGCGANAKRREKQQDGELRYLKRRFRLGCRQGHQYRNPAEELYHENEDVEIQRDHRGNRVGPPPDSEKPV